MPKFMSEVTKSIAVPLLLVFLFAGACSRINSSASPVPSQSDKVVTYADPFAYCTAVGTIDSPDTRYIGPAMPDSIIKGMLERGIITADAPAEFQKNAVWRCMDNQVWVCHFGANLPCLEKADTSKAPTPGMVDYCKANPDVVTIPAAVTGRATVYTWKCNSGQAEIIERVFQVDPRGYLANFWYELTPK